jgi:cytohesin
VIQGDLKMLKTLVAAEESPDDAYNVQYYFGQSLIHCAIKRDNKETFSHLLKHGADPNLATDFRETPLMEAASMGRFEYIDALIKHGADVNAKDDDGKTALHYAAENSVKCIVKLIHHGADVNVADDLKVTPLMVAAERGNLNGVKELLKYGADRDMENDEGMTAAEIAESRGRHEVQRYIERFNENRVITDYQ